MKVISYGSHYEIYEDDLKTHDALPAQTYAVKFNKMSGFSLKKVDDFTTIEEKVYGTHQDKLNKTVSTFEKFSRSLGVILSGDKGIGKSMFTQMLAEKMVSKGYPVIIVDTAYVGIANFIDSIDQEVFVLFDEFEKVFNSRKDGIESQEALLGLFDGTSQKKRLYAITVNNLRGVNEFMINRPGRFHYHFRFAYPSAEEINMYLRDKIPAENYKEISDVVSFSRRVRLNFDCLRAIAFELSNGSTFKTAINDLNILDIEDQYYSVTLEFEGGLKPIKYSSVRLDLFQEKTSFSDYIERDDVRISFEPKSMSVENSSMVADGSTVEIMFYDEDERKESKYGEAKVSRIVVTQVPARTYAYKAF